MKPPEPGHSNHIFNCKFNIFDGDGIPRPQPHFRRAWVFGVLRNWSVSSELSGEMSLHLTLGVHCSQRPGASLDGAARSRWAIRADGGLGGGLRHGAAPITPTHAGFGAAGMLCPVTP